MKTIKVLFLCFSLCIAIYFLMGYRARNALERAVCNGRHDVLCHQLRYGNARAALDAAWFTWPWTVGLSEEDLQLNFVRHFL